MSLSRALGVSPRSSDGRNSQLYGGRILRSEGGYWIVEISGREHKMSAQMGVSPSVGKFAKCTWGGGRGYITGILGAAHRLASKEVWIDG